MRLDAPRIPPLTAEQLDAETRERLERRDGADGRVLNIFGTLANHPKLLKRWGVFGDHVLSKSSLPPRERELVILRVGWLCRSGYEWGQHVRIGKQAGLSDAEIERIGRGPDDPAWSDADALLLRAADELHADQFVSDSTWSALAARWSTQQMIDLVFAVGQYTLVSMALNSLGVQLDPGVGSLPASRLAAPFDTGVVDRLLSTTRSVRKRLDLERPVEREVILECLRLAIQAPTGSNSQGWRFVVVTDAGQRKALADIYRRAGEEYLAQGAAQARAGGNRETEKVLDSALYLVDHLADVPVHVIPCILGRVPDGAPAGAHAGFYGSIFPAVWSFQLALRSRGLGSVLTTIHLGREQEAAKLLGIPDTVTQAGLLPVAYTRGTDFRPAQRRPIEEITYFGGWKAATGGLVR
jgi:nitroreductase/alkylhydroperoxidase family enzyme